MSPFRNSYQIYHVPKYSYFSVFLLLLLIEGCCSTVGDGLIYSDSAFSIWRLEAFIRSVTVSYVFLLDCAAR